MKVFPICYFPPVHWCAAAIHESVMALEVCQHYRKQQYTSRTHIRVANRVLPLTLPVERRGAKVPIQDKHITFQDNWPHQHWASLVSAYRNSPYFEYYEDELRPFFEKPETQLVPHLLNITVKLWELMQLSADFRLTQAFLPSDTYTQDLRQTFDASRRSYPEAFVVEPYTQVFEPFESGLSILDVLFNLGPETPQYLRKVWRVG
ncbi:MAG: WbqC family protein [Bacteroidota bacterium]